jgi:hypothetical protein
MLERICPTTWNTAIGAVVRMISSVGGINPPCSAGIALPSAGYACAAFESTTHHPITNMNCISVSVIGLGNPLSIDLEDVLVMAELMYLCPTFHR